MPAWRVSSLKVSAKSNTLHLHICKLIFCSHHRGSPKLLCFCTRYHIFSLCVSVGGGGGWDEHKDFANWPGTGRQNSLTVMNRRERRPLLSSRIHRVHYFISVILTPVRVHFMWSMPSSNGGSIRSVLHTCFNSFALFFRGLVWHCHTGLIHCLLK